MNDEGFWKKHWAWEFIPDSEFEHAYLHEYHNKGVVLSFYAAPTDVP